MSFDAKAVTEKIAALVTRDNVAGVSVCVKGSEGIVYEHGFGYRDADRSITPDGDTIFGIASMSKSITSLALAILETEGKLSYDDPVSKYFPNFSVPGAAKDTVTLRTLAMHTAGIPPMEPLEWSIAMNSTGHSGDWADAMRKSAPNPMETIDQVIDYIASCPYPTVGAPGENMSYSNEGYAIMSYVADMAAGMPLEKFCEERIFRPIGMTRTIMSDYVDPAREISGGNLTSLFEEAKGELICDDDWSVLPPFRGCAMVKSTARDMAAYYRCLSNGGVHEGVQVIPKAAVDALIGPWVPADFIASYGLGLYKRTRDGHTICEHGGALHGISTKGGLLQNEGYGFAVLSNTGDKDMDDIMWVLYNAVIGLPLETSHRWFVPAGRDFSDPEMLLGNFICHEGIPVTAAVKMGEKGLCAKIGENETVLVYCGGTRFLAMDAANPDNLRSRLEFFIRNGRAWGVRCGSRIYSAEN